LQIGNNGKFCEKVFRFAQSVGGEGESHGEPAPFKVEAKKRTLRCFAEDEVGEFLEGLKSHGSDGNGTISDVAIMAILKN